ncbi:hypothetical protein [Endozoicomonas sp. 8E]|uniref:hypothetical protein n=1 Tax=Endozoicomonas sp. 8E TaxID=3035692 RepID=UPI00293906D8|nr:hypothetical protein [Endozoicomonas sp. 8E]WOG29284.1 hypothetical protein P6910_06410 [Endozoicomonas sp. 8E]
MVTNCHYRSSQWNALPRDCHSVTLENCGRIIPKYPRQANTGISLTVHFNHTTTQVKLGGSLSEGS